MVNTCLKKLPQEIVKPGDGSRHVYICLVAHPFKHNRFICYSLCPPELFSRRHYDCFFVTLVILSQIRDLGQ